MATDNTQDHTSSHNIEPASAPQSRSFRSRGFWMVITAIITGVLGLVAVCWFVYLSGQRVLSQLEVTLFTVIITILQVGFGLIAGLLTSENSARREYRPFVRSALRRTYGLVEGLGRVQESIREGVRRMSTRTSSEVNSQLWEEIMNTIYSQSNELLREAKASIEDWREFGREEIEKLEQNQREKERQIAEIKEDIDALHGVMAQLSITPSAEPALQKMESVANSLEGELQSIRDRSVLEPTEANTIYKRDVKKLLSTGAFKEAIEIYSRMIDLNPASHSLYMGRARAKYLIEDKEGALADLDRAEQLHPADPTIGRAKQRIMEGKSFPVSGLSLNMVMANDGHEALAQGRIEDARQLFKEAKNQGLNIAFTNINFAMVELAARNTQEARKHLDVIDSSSTGPFMRVQVECLRALCTAIEGKEPDLNGLRQAREQRPDFDMNKSPLQFLEKGLTQVGLLDDRIRRIFDLMLHERILSERHPQ
jgi:tetratricopeptide (TPR) repeat protein